MAVIGLQHVQGPRLLRAILRCKLDALSSIPWLIFWHACIRHMMRLMLILGLMCVYISQCHITDVPRGGLRASAKQMCRGWLCPSRGRVIGWPCCLAQGLPDGALLSVAAASDEAAGCGGMACRWGHLRACIMSWAGTLKSMQRVKLVTGIPAGFEMHR